MRNTNTKYQAAAGPAQIKGRAGPGPARARAGCRLVFFLLWQVEAGSFRLAGWHAEPPRYAVLE